MGISPDAELIWGVVVKNDQIITEIIYKGDPPFENEQRPAYDPESGWDELEGTRLEFVQVGHYEDPDPFAILTLKGCKRFNADAWDPQPINPRNDLLWEPADKQITKGGDEAVSLGLPDLRDGQWLLIAGLG